MTVAFSETGSADHVESYQTMPATDPKVGMGATLLGWTDRYAGTIIDITGGIVTVQEDRAIRTDSNGASADQSYRYEPDTDGAQHFYSNETGSWQPVEWNDHRHAWVSKAAGYPVRLGKRDEYFDHSY